MMTTEAQKLPKGWQWVEIKDVADIIVPTRDKPKRFCGDIPWITLPELDDFFVSTAKNLLTHEDAAEVGNRLMPPNTVLLSCAGSLGKVAVTTREVYANQQFYGLVAKANVIDPIFLAFSLKMLGEDFFFQLAGVSTVGFFSKDKALGIKIVLPPLAEQKRIAAIAQKADRLRRTRRYALQLSDTYLQSVFLEMFGDPIANPKGWKTKLLDEISEVQGGLQLSQKRDNLELKLPYLRVANVYRNQLDLSEIKTIGLTKDEFIRVKLQKDDILIVEGHGNAAEIGRCAVWDSSIKDCVHQNHLIRVRVNPKIINSAYLSHYVNNSGGQKYFHTSSNTTSGLNTISTGIVKQCIVPIPPLPLQEKFAQIVQKFERLRTQQREADRQAEHLFQTLLHRAFRGELTPQHADDEPASVLLEEIGAEQAQVETETKAATQAMDDAAEYLGMKAKQQDTEPIQLKLPGIE